MNMMYLFTFISPKIRKYSPLALLLTVVFVATGCAVGAGPPAVVCDSLNSGIYTLRLAGSVFIVLTVVIIGASFLGQKILKTTVAIGATVVTLIIGVVLLVSAPAITSTFLTAGGASMPDIIALCSIS